MKLSLFLPEYKGEEKEHGIAFTFSGKIQADIEINNEGVLLVNGKQYSPTFQVKAGLFELRLYRSPTRDSYLVIAEQTVILPIILFFCSLLANSLCQKVND